MRKITGAIMLALLLCFSVSTFAGEPTPAVRQGVIVISEDPIPVTPPPIVCQMYMWTDGSVVVVCSEDPNPIDPEPEWF